MVSSFINFYDEVYRSYMDTNHVEFVNASPMPSSIPVIPAKDERDIRSSQRPKALFNLASSSKWGWQDALYLFILLLSVVAMARYFTPDFTGEVAGMWWDPLLNMWTLSWDTTTLLHAPTHLWQAQLLYPNNLTLTYSENLLGEAIFFAPFFLATHNPVLAYNVTFYLAFLLCGINMYIVARHYTGKSLAALVAALIYAFSPVSHRTDRSYPYCRRRMDSAGIALSRSFIPKRPLASLEPVCTILFPASTQQYLLWHLPELYPAGIYTHPL